MSRVHGVRAVWKALVPESVRYAAQPVLRRFLLGYFRRLSRKPHDAEVYEGPIRVVGYFANTHGITASARLAVRAFQALGVPVEAVDVSPAETDWAGTPGVVRTPGPWIFHINAPQMLGALIYLGPRQVRGPRFGYWAWELPKAPKSWLKDGALVDEIWAPSEYTATSLAGAKAPVRVVPHPIFLEDYRDVAPLPRAPGFLAVSLFDFNSSMARKNPQGVIAAFSRAFPNDPTARLIIKTQKGAIFPELLAKLRSDAPPNVEILDAVWPYSQVKALIASADVLISLHRAEGFGLTMAEAMALSVPVIATGWSGNSDFIDDTCALVAPSTPVAVDDPQGIYKGQTWAEPDIEVAAQHLIRLRGDPVLASHLRQAGKRRVAERLSPQAWFATLPNELRKAAMVAASRARKNQAAD
ncbi:glycosyltransferase family 4 protein [Phenylobacterium sp.]|uniref:glycosyltransferase family 4 protein n=1 Tax=Phenylobacterium sp. TaxID=1871053 RepID=UPI00286C88CD|nr:glycosyltransferase family 4 protein [Phenylobacterium sp.]